MFTFPLSPIQPNSCNLTKPQAVHTCHQMVTTYNIKKSNITMLHFTPTPVCNPVFHWNQHPCRGLFWSTNLLQLSANKQVFLLILASILIWVWRKFLTLACPKNEEGGQTQIRQTDRQTESKQTDADGTGRRNRIKQDADRSQTWWQHQVDTDKRRHRRNDHRTTTITIRSRRRRRTTHRR